METTGTKLKVDVGRLKPHQTYRDIASHPLPGFSAIMGVVNKPALVKWAWQLGRDGIDLDKGRQQAFDIGTCAHFMIECHINGWEADLGDFTKKDIDAAENSFLKFLDFWKGFTLVKSEYQMASTQLGYGGTADIIATDDVGRLCLIDVKTSKAVYPEYKVQLCAYKRLWDDGDVEMVDGEPKHRDDWHHPIDRMICVRIGKEEEGDVEAHEVPMKDYDKYLDVFDAAHALYLAQRALKWR